MFRNFTIDPLAMFMYIIKPAFSDLIPGTSPYDGTLHEFTLYDNVTSKRPIIDIRKIKNVLQRRDKSCDIIYSKIAGTSTRQIEVTELQAGVKHCKHEFYQGALVDWRSKDPLFGNRLIDNFFKDAIKTDIASNSYFGDVSRPVNPASEWSLTVYDGIFTWIKKYISVGVIPSGQTFTIPTVDLRADPATAFAIIKNLYDKQPLLMRNMAPSEKAFYVSQPVIDGYKEYLRSLGNGDANTIAMYANGVSITSYNGIALLPEPTWEPILAELGGANSNAAILTLRGNFIFGTDKNYGEEDDFEKPVALHVWREKKELSWYWQMFLKAGTQIALPEFLVVGITNFNL